jgi:hypothetical protein
VNSACAQSCESLRRKLLCRALLIGALANVVAAPATFAADAAVSIPAPATTATTATTDDATGENLELAGPKKQQAASLIEEAIGIGYRNREARTALARGGASLLPRLQGRNRAGLTNRWAEQVSTSAVPRSAQLSAFAAFFDAVGKGNASAADIEYARAVAMMLPDPLARAGAFVRLSEAVERRNWDMAAQFGMFAQRAARQESDPVLRARMLTYVANRLASLNPETRAAAVVEASSQARMVTDNATVRESLLASLAGSAAKFDIPLAQRIAASLSNEDMKNLATARIAVAQTQSSFAVKKPDPDRVAAIVKGVSRYDTSFIPVLLQLPATPEVFQALGDALPPIYPTSSPAVDASTLERIWAFTEKAEPSVYRDQLQSRAARLMVLLDLWRGRDWGQKLAWEGGRTQIANFVEATLHARESQLEAEPLRALADKDVNKAITQARRLESTERVEALLLIAGQLLA